MRPAVVMAIVAGMAVAVGVAVTSRDDKQAVLGAPSTHPDRSDDSAKVGADPAPAPEATSGCEGALACLEAGDADLAYHAAISAGQETLACVAAALRGEDELAATAGGADPQCLAARTWALVRRGEVTDALITSAQLQRGGPRLARAAAQWAAGLDDAAVASINAAAVTAPAAAAVPFALVDSLLARAIDRQRLTPDDPALHRARMELDRLVAERPEGDGAARLSEAWSAAAPSSATPSSATPSSATR